MKDLQSLKQRLMKETPAARLGHLAADFFRIANFIEDGLLDEARPIVRESKWFSEWIAPEADRKTQGFLADVQSYLALKELQWAVWTQDRAQLSATASTIRVWSKDLIKFSGLAA